MFAALYAGVLDPAVRVTSSTLSSIINGGATVMMAIFIAPHMSGMTDDVVEGRVSESQFRRAVVWLVGSRLAGTLLAQALLVPSALLVVYVARAVGRCDLPGAPRAGAQTLLRRVLLTWRAVSTLPKERR